MAGQSLIKLMGNNSIVNNGRGPVSYGRADIDGAPYRGEPIMATEEEMESRLTKVTDPHNRTFDLSRPEDNKAYLEVMDLICNGWAECLHRKHLEIPTTKTLSDGTVEHDIRIKVYMEWAVFFMEDGKPMHSQRPYVGRPNDE